MTKKNPIPMAEVQSLLAQIKEEMLNAGFSAAAADGARIQVIHLDYWEISLFVPASAVTSGIRYSTAMRRMQDILFRKCGIKAATCDFFGREHSPTEFEWYFRHPHIPQEINRLIDEENAAEEAAMRPPQIPVPSSSKSSGDTAFVTVKDEFFREIAKGKKNTEYRALTQYYCNKFLGGGKAKRFLKLNRGYLSGKENQMVFEIDNIYFVNEDGSVEYPAVGNDGKPICSYAQLPRRFVPVAYGIRLGKRVA